LKNYGSATEEVYFVPGNPTAKPPIAGGIYARSEAAYQKFIKDFIPVTSSKFTLGARLTCFGIRFDKARSDYAFAKDSRYLSCLQIVNNPDYIEPTKPKVVEEKKRLLKRIGQGLRKIGKRIKQAAA